MCAGACEVGKLFGFVVCRRLCVAQILLRNFTRMLKLAGVRRRANHLEPKCGWSDLHYLFIYMECGVFCCLRVISMSMYSAHAHVPKPVSYNLCKRIYVNVYRTNKHENKKYLYVTCDRALANVQSCLSRNSIWPARLHCGVFLMLGTHTCGR